MSEKKPSPPSEKSELHPRNRHRQPYDFALLTQTCPELAGYVKLNPYGNVSIDFANPKAVKWLNKALLKSHYDISYWDIPSGYLCPPIPGRADYVHSVADLLGASNQGRIPVSKKICCMDIGVGASCIYPILGTKEYGWSFIGTEIDEAAFLSAAKIVNNNPQLARTVQLRRQPNPKDIIHGVLERNVLIDLLICNPPFHASAEEAQSAALRKVSNLNRKKITQPVLNFGGQSHELWCEGGELRFVRDLIRQSKQFSENCFWFTTLVSKQSHLPQISKALQAAGAQHIKTIPMSQGMKLSRLVAWTFLSSMQQQKWIQSRWTEFKSEK